jgi:hypothetical protein
LSNGVVNQNLDIDPLTINPVKSEAESFMEFEAEYVLVDSKLKVESQGKANAVLDQKYLTLNVEFAQPIVLQYIDITQVFDHDYQIDLFLTSKETLKLSGLGYQYEDFLFSLYRLRNELLLKYMLMGEALIKGGFEAKFSLFDSKGQMVQIGDCEIRVYENAVVVMLQKGEPIRFPYCYVSKISKLDYRLVLNTDLGENAEFSMLGEKFELFSKTLSEAYSKMMQRSQQTIKELMGEADPLTVRRLSDLMRDGLAAKRKDIDQVSVDFWSRLQNRIKLAGLSQEYSFLESLALKDTICFGVKRGLMGNLTGSYNWLFFPFLDSKSGRIGNAVALEAFAFNESVVNNVPENETDMEVEGGKEDLSGGKATYFFRVMSRKDYPQVESEKLRSELDNFLRDINRCLVDTNFRREIIYLPEASFADPKYVDYRYAVDKMPAVQTLRDHFIGRVVHMSFEQWKRDVTSLLDFNVKSKDDKEKYLKGEN